MNIMLLLRASALAQFLGYGGLAAIYFTAAFYRNR